MPARLKIILCFAVACSGCAAAPRTVITRDAAILAADRACHESWGRYVERQGHDWQVTLKSWNAELAGDRWKAWVGDKKRPDVNIDVPSDGSPPDPGSCSLFFQD